MRQRKRLFNIVFFVLLFSLEMACSLQAREREFGKLIPVTVEIPFSLELSGRNAPQSDFRIYMERSVESPNAPLPDPYYIDIQCGEGKEKRSFTNMEFLETGVYLYKIRQEQKNYEGFSYDSAVYDIEIQILKADLNKDGNVVEPYLYAVVQGQKEGEEQRASKISFVNEYLGKRAKGLDKKKVKRGNYPALKSRASSGRSEVLSAERNPIDRFSKALPKAYLAAKRFARGDVCKNLLNGLTTFLTTGSLLFWFYRLRRQRDETMEKNE